MNDATRHQDTSTSQYSLHEVMLRDHDRIERLLDELSNAFEADACSDAARLWVQVEAALDAHFALEEQYILPWFEQVEPAEVEALRREHAELRTQLLALGIGVDLHFVRFDMVQELVRKLRAHAQREDAMLYRWADARQVERIWVAQLARALARA